MEAGLLQLVQQVHHRRDAVADLRGDDLLEGGRDLLRQAQPPAAGHRGQEVRGWQHQHQSQEQGDPTQRHW